MLINTNQIIDLTTLRLGLGQFIDQANAGKTFLISDKGKIKAAIVPSLIGKQTAMEELAKRYLDIQRRMAKGGKGKKGWDSTRIIRKMRDDRTKYLLKREGML